MYYKKSIEERNPNTQEAYKRTPKRAREERKKIRESNHNRGQPSSHPRE